MCRAVTYITKVEGVDSGLDEEGIVWGQSVFELSLLVLGLVVDLQKEQGVKLFLYMCAAVQ